MHTYNGPMHMYTVLYSTHKSDLELMYKNRVNTVRPDYDLLLKVIAGLSEERVDPQGWNRCDGILP